MCKIDYKDYLRTDKLPHTWCAGCGDGIVLQSIARAFAELELDKRNTVVVTGIGCWGKSDTYISTNIFHGTHGRALPFATGIKLANPELDVIVLMGDGDGLTIGGNHLVHAARRNIDLTVVVANNYNYGQTGGQYSGTTLENYYTSTSRYGHLEESIDGCKITEAAGASYIARGTINNPTQIKRFVKEGIQKKGFAYIEAIAPCPTHFGRLNNMRTATQMMEWMKESTISIRPNMNPEDAKGKILLGKMVDREVKDYGTKYQEMIDHLQNGGK